MGRKKIILLALVVLLIQVRPPSGWAVNFYDGSRAKQGLYFLTYTSFYYADEFADRHGDPVKKDFGLFNAQEMLRLCYYSPNFVATALIPFGYTDIHSLHEGSAGLGDINLGAGYFLPIQQIDILPMLFVKFPTGEYDAARPVNIGANQYDIKPVVFLHKTLDKFSLDAAAKYHIRLENSDTHVRPGDEFYLQCLLGYHLTDKLKFGPSLNWMISREKEQNGTAVDGTARESFSAGADIYYRFSRLSVTLTYLYDFYAENLPQGHFFQIKTVYRF
ncbi:MAG TPA: transporter [Smithella sp.]|nr:transporter [Smithella sp.]